MSISAMKQALEAMEIAHDESLDGNEFECRQILVAQITYLRTAIEQAEKQEPVAWVENLTDPQPHAVTDLKYCSVAQRESGEDLKYVPLYPAPVHASDISQERVDETAKDRHEPVPNDYDRSIHSNPDAQAWAKFFMATVNEQEWCIDDIDESLMTGWFANAMMAMHDHVKREWVGLDGDIPGLGLVTEEFYNGMLCAEDILRKRNT